MLQKKSKAQPAWAMPVPTAHSLIGGGVGGVGVDSVAEASHGGGDGNLGVAGAVGTQVVHCHGVRPSSIDGCIVVVHALEQKQIQVTSFEWIEIDISS